MKEALITLIDICKHSSSESKKLRAALGILDAENIKLQRERIDERKERYCLLFPPKED